MDFAQPDYLNDWKKVDAREFEAWLAGGAPDYLVRSRYCWRDYFTRYGEFHFASAYNDDHVIVDPRFLIERDSTECQRSS